MTDDKLMTNPEFARAYRRRKFWRPVINCVESIQYHLAYWLTWVAISVCDYGMDDASDDWWKAYRKRNGISEEEAEADRVDAEIAAMSPDELADEIAALAGSRPDWPD